MALPIQITNDLVQDFPPPGSGPYRIYRQWCLGDSLPYINGNTVIFTNELNGLLTTIASISGNLLSTILGLSSNIDNMNITAPYSRLAELPGKDSSISNLNTITGSTGTNSSEPAQLIFPKSTAITTTRFLTLIDTPTNYVDDLNIIKNPDRSIRFSSTGTYEIHVQAPILSLHNSGARGSFDIRLIDGSNNVILAGTPIHFNLFYSNPAKLQGRFNVTNTSTNYFIQIRRNLAGLNFGICATIPDTTGNGVLFNVDLWKVN